MSRATLTQTTTQTVKLAPRVERQLLTELNGYAAIAAEMKGLDSAKKGHSSKVLELALENIDADKFEVGGHKVAVVKGAKNRKLNVEKLLKRFLKDGSYSMKAGKALIEDCTDESPKKDHVRITVPGEADESRAD